MKTRSAFGLLFILGTSASAASANLIQYEWVYGSVNGSFGETSFSDAQVTFTAQASTENIVSEVNVFTNDLIYSNRHTQMSATIEGVGTFDFTTETRSFSNVSFGVGGFQSLEPFPPDSGFPEDEFNILDHMNIFDSAYSSWTMDTEIVISQLGSTLQWDRLEFGFMATDGLTEQEFFIEDISSVPTVFTASFVPTPGSLMVLGISGLVCTSRRRAVSCM